MIILAKIVVINNIIMMTAYVEKCTKPNFSKNKFLQQMIQSLKSLSNVYF